MATFCAVKLSVPLRCGSSSLGCLSCVWVLTTRFSLKTLDVSSVLKQTYLNNFDDFLYCHRIFQYRPEAGQSKTSNHYWEAVQIHLNKHNKITKEYIFNAELCEYLITCAAWGLKVRRSASFGFGPGVQLFYRIYCVNVIMACKWWNHQIPYFCTITNIK